MTKVYKSEAEFLKDYDASGFEKLSLTSDILIFSVSTEETENYRKLSQKQFSVLLVKRDNYPFKDKWCLPGSFVKINENIEDAAKRILVQETNLHDIYLEQLYTFGDVNRDPRMRIISTSYMALVDKSKIKDKLCPWASWFNITTFKEDDKKITCILDNGQEKIKFICAKNLRDKTTDRYDYKITENDSLAFDHPLMIISGIQRLKNKLQYTDVVFNMMPELFTLGELQQVYESILGTKLLDAAFRRIIANKVEKTTKMTSGAGHRPSVLFRYKK